MKSARALAARSCLIDSQQGEGRRRVARELYVLAGLAPLSSEGAGGRLLVALDEPWSGLVLSILSAAGHDALPCDPSDDLLARVSRGGHRVLVTHAH